MTKKTYRKLTSFLLWLLMLLAAFTPAVAALGTINTSEGDSLVLSTSATLNTQNTSDASIGIGGGHMAWPKNGGGIIIKLIHKYLELEVNNMTKRNMKRSIVVILIILVLMLELLSFALGIYIFCPPDLRSRMAFRVADLFDRAIYADDYEEGGWRYHTTDPTLHIPDTQSHRDYNEVRLWDDSWQTSHYYQYYRIDGFSNNNFIIQCHPGFFGCAEYVVKKKTCTDIPLFDFPLQQGKIYGEGWEILLNETELQEFTTTLEQNLNGSKHRSDIGSNTGITFYAKFKGCERIYYSTGIGFVDDKWYLIFYYYDSESEIYLRKGIRLPDNIAQQLNEYQS